jgi:hypothetical protein
MSLKNLMPLGFECRWAFYADFFSHHPISDAVIQAISGLRIE